MRPEQEKQDLPTRTRIIEAGLGLFAERGYEGSSVQDIALAVGIKPASLYAHFAGKEAIFRAVLERALADWKGLADAALAAGEPEPDLARATVRVISAFISSMADSTALRFWTRVYMFPPETMKAADFAECRALDAEFAERLKRFCARRAGLDPRSRSLGSFAAALTHFMTGVMVNAAGLPPPEREIEEGVALLARGFVAGAPRKT